MTSSLVISKAKKKSEAMNKDLVAIFEYLEREKGIKRDVIAQAIEESLRIAARKSINDVGNLNVSVDPKTGEISAIAEKEIVETVEYPDEEIGFEEAREIDPDCQLGQWIDVEIDPLTLGRIAAQTARQVITQKLRGAERDVVYEEYRHRINELISGTVKRITKGRTLIIDLGKVEAILPDRYYPKLERYHLGDKVMAVLYEVRENDNGSADVVLSRTHPQLVVELFEQEVPELGEGLITINRIVRDGGYRTKMAVSSTDPKIDPVGACVGVRGTRVKNIIRELNNEKIDVFPYSEDLYTLLKNALSPVNFKKVEVDEETDIVTIVVEDEDYPAVLGRKGINARLTGELIGYELKIYKASEYDKQRLFELGQLARSENPLLDEPLALEGLNPLILDSLTSAGYDTPRKLLLDPAATVSEKSGLSPEMIGNILEEVRASYRWEVPDDENEEKQEEEAPSIKEEE
ncbi:MAG: transcription termination factor NusA [Simkaniaceae bacterium]|nr:transcription termination factor NusA [Simkaniaceae bacterium]